MFMLVLSIMPTFTSCDKVENDGPFGISPFTLFVRFESPNGTNILDSLNIIGDVNKDERILNIDNGEIDVKCYRVSDNKLLETISELWIRANESWNSKDNPDYHYEKLGTMLRTSFVDADIWNEGKGSTKHDESYVVNMKSHKIFGNDKTHTIKWYIHIYGRGYYEAYKCEVDGKQVSLDNDPLYQSQNNNHGIYAINTVQILGN